MSLETAATLRNSVCRDASVTKHYIVKVTGYLPKFPNQDKEFCINLPPHAHKAEANPLKTNTVYGNCLDERRGSNTVIRNIQGYLRFAPA